ncbi:unnamed protein product [Discosporangium mesarthrocarpum]
MFGLLLVSVTNKLLESADELAVVWLGYGNVGLVVSNIIFCLCVAGPLWRIACDPTAKSKRLYSEKIYQRRKSRKIASNSSNNMGVNTKVRAETPMGTDEEVWDYETFIAKPLLAFSLEDFARRALCHESYLFLAEVTRYERGDYSLVKVPGVAIADQFDAASYIVKTFVSSGAPKEINISGDDRTRIMGRCSFQRTWFYSSMSDEERRVIFRRAYDSIRDIIESNLLGRFICTEEFQRAKERSERLEVRLAALKSTKVTCALTSSSP